jgi:kynureninase
MFKVPEKVSAQHLAGDEDFWRKVAHEYAVNQDIVNLEGGYYGIISRPVHREYSHQIEALKENNSHYLRTRLEDDYDAVRRQVAGLLGALPEEIAFTRNATEALQHLIGNYKKVRAGDTVLYADLDYPDMQPAMNWLRLRRGAVVAKFDLPELATRQAVLDAYEKALVKYPQTKLLLVTHMSNRTGLVPPTSDIVAMARARGVDVIVDAVGVAGRRGSCVGATHTVAMAADRAPHDGILPIDTRQHGRDIAHHRRDRHRDTDRVHAGVLRATLLHHGWPEDRVAPGAVVQVGQQHVVANGR